MKFTFFIKLSLVFAFCVLWIVASVFSHLQKRKTCAAGFLFWRDWRCRFSHLAHLASCEYHMRSGFDCIYKRVSCEDILRTCTVGDLWIMETSHLDSRSFRGGLFHFVGLLLSDWEASVDSVVHISHCYTLFVGPHIWCHGLLKGCLRWSRQVAQQFRNL